MSVRLADRIPITFDAKIDTEVDIHDRVPVRLGTIHLDADAVGFELD